MTRSSPGEVQTAWNSFTVKITEILPSFHYSVVLHAAASQRRGEDCPVLMRDVMRLREMD
jgi:hypothetical protein